MSYTPTTWATGDVITADKLNNMEDGIVKAVRMFKVTVTNSGNDESVMNKTCGEIKDAIMNGYLVLAETVTTEDGQTEYMQAVPDIFSFNEGGGCAIQLWTDSYQADTDSDYPTFKTK